MAINNHSPSGQICLRSLVDDLIPEHIRYSNPKLIDVLKEYMDFLEHEHKAGYYINKLGDQRDIDRVEEDFLQLIQKEIGAPIPQTFAASPRLFYKQITDLYISRGTSDSIKTFFKLLFNDDVEIFYPVEELLIPSDGKWYDSTQDIINNRDAFSPLYTFTVSQPTSVLSGLDDGGRLLQFNNPVIFVNGSHYTTATPQVTVNEVEGKLDYALEFNPPLQTNSVIEIYTEGAFTNNDGLLSNYRYIQDSFFYQKFSYVLRTGTDIDLWKNAFDRLIHPAGFIFFGEVVLFLNGKGYAPPLTQPGRQVGGLAVPIIIPRVNAKSRLHPSQPIKELIVGELKDTGNPLGPAQYLDQVKFGLSSPIAAFDEFTFEDAINKAISINMDAEITIS